MGITLEVTPILVLLRDGSDKICLTTTLPEGCFPYKEEGMSFYCDVAADAGMDCIEPEIINCRKKHIPYVRRG